MQNLSCANPRLASRLIVLANTMYFENALRTFAFILLQARPKLSLPSPPKCSSIMMSAMLATRSHRVTLTNGAIFLQHGECHARDVDSQGVLLCCWPHVDRHCSLVCLCVPWDIWHCMGHGMSSLAPHVHRQLSGCAWTFRLGVVQGLRLDPPSLFGWFLGWGDSECASVGVFRPPCLSLFLSSRL